MPKTREDSVDRNSLAVVQEERDPAVDPSSSTEMLDPIPENWSPRDEPGDLNEKKLPHFITFSPP